MAPVDQWRKGLNLLPCFLAVWLGCAPLAVQVKEDGPGAQGKSADKDTFRFALVKGNQTAGLGDFDPWGMGFLRDMIEAHTSFRAEAVDGGAALSPADERLRDIPVLFVDDLRAEDSLDHLIPHLATGGFLIGRLIGPNRRIPFAGNAISSAPLEAEHPVFSAYYDLKAGIPAPAVRSTFAKNSNWGKRLKFTGYFYGGQLVGVASAPGLSWRHYRNTPEYEDLPVEIKMAVNLMVYARLQKEALAQGEGGGEKDNSTLIEK